MPILIRGKWNQSFLVDSWPASLETFNGHVISSKHDRRDVVPFKAASTEVTIMPQGFWSICALGARPAIFRKRQREKVGNIERQRNVLPLLEPTFVTSENSTGWSVLQMIVGSDLHDWRCSHFFFRNSVKSEQLGVKSSWSLKYDVRQL